MFQHSDANFMNWLRYYWRATVWHFPANGMKYRFRISKTIFRSCQKENTAIVHVLCVESAVRPKAESLFPWFDNQILFIFCIFLE